MDLILQKWQERLAQYVTSSSGQSEQVYWQDTVDVDWTIRTVKGFYT